MKLRRIIAFFALSGLLALSAFYFLRPNHQQRAQHALAHILKDRFQAGEKIIDALPQSFPLALYRGYLQQAMGYFRESDRCLQQALAQARTDEIVSEIFLAQATNAYMQNRDQDFSRLVERAERALPLFPQLPLFEGINHYLHGNFNEALQYWATYKPEETCTWLSGLTQRMFPAEWLELHRAHCLVQGGDYLTSREILERELHLSENRTEGLGTLLLGLTYLKEAETLSSSERASFYKVARFYFARGHFETIYSREKAFLVSSVEKTASDTILSAELLNSGLTFVKTLQEWNAQESIEKIAHSVALSLLAKKDPSFCLAIREALEGGAFHQSLINQLVLTITEQLKTGTIEDLFGLWGTVEALSPAPAIYAHRIASLTADEILQTIELDNEDLTKTLTYLTFWKHVENNPSRKMHFARGLLAHGEVLWRKEGFERKGTRLMSIAVQLCQEKERVLLLKEIEQFLLALYAQAEGTNMVQRLSLIFEALDHFNLGIKHLFSPAKVANHLADAAYHYRVHNYPSAQAHAEWVLKLEPKNQEASRLFGLACYHLGEYQRAYIALQRLSHLDEETQRTLFFCKTFSLEAQECHLARINNL